MKTLSQVQEFQQAFEIPMPKTPTMPARSSAECQHLGAYAQRLKALSEELMRACSTQERSMPLLRLHLIVEETSELAEALARGDLVECLDALTDLRYVCDGTTLCLGLENVFEVGFDEVHRSNMSKLVDGRPVKNEAGRVIKGEGYSPPDLQRVTTEAC